MSPVGTHKPPPHTPRHQPCSPHHRHSTTHIHSPAGDCTDADGYTGYDQHATGQYYTSYTGVYGNWNQCATDCDNNANCWGFLISTGANGCYPYLSDPTAGGLQMGNSGMTVYEKCISTGILFHSSPIALWLSLCLAHLLLVG